MCDLHICMCCCDHAEVELTLLRSTSSKMRLTRNRKIRATGIKGSGTKFVASSFEPNLCVAYSTLYPDLTLFHQATKTAVRYQASHSLAWTFSESISTSQRKYSVKQVTANVVAHHISLAMQRIDACDLEGSLEDMAAQQDTF
jgi:hypothetical protein